MKHTQKLPSGRLVYRRAVPAQLRPFVAKREHKVPIGREGSPGLLARWEAADAEFGAIIIKAVRQRDGDFDELGPARIAHIAEAYRVAELEADTLRRWDARAKGRAAAVSALILDAEDTTARIPADPAGRWTLSVRAGAMALVEAGKELRANGDLEGIVEAWRGPALLTAEQCGYLISSDSPGFPELCIALNDAAVSAHEAMIERLDGSHLPTPLKPRRPDPVQRAPTAVRVALPMLEAFDSYAAAQGMTAGVRKDWRRMVEHLVGFLGYDDAARLTTEDLMRWRDHLLETPTSLGKPRDPVTVKSKYIASVKAMLTWAVQERKLPANVAVGVVVRTPKKPKLRDRDFTDEEARAILKATLEPASPNMAAGHVMARRWIPWLCAYTGARVNEFSQLRGEDVREVDGQWTVRITPEAGTVKAKAARVIPLHPHLIEQGFPEVAKAKGQGPLFYDPSKTRVTADSNRHFKKVGERLAAWVRNDVGIKDPSVQPNHGWRHMFKTRAFSAGIQERIVDAIQGHAPVTVSRTYGSVPLADMVTAIKGMPRFVIAEA